MESKKRRFSKKSRVGAFVLRFFLICLTVFVLAGIGIFGYFSKDLPTLAKIEKQKNSQSSKIYDRTGEILLFEIKGEEERILVPLSEISPWLQKATIACEDSNFYKHFGLNFKAILRAVLNNLIVKFGLGERKTIQGGSTITQQIIKNALLTPERTLTRKIKEAILAVELEFRYSKNQILELYLNQVFYGLNAYGVETASRLYFDKPAKELDLTEGAILAALPKAPTRLSPHGSHLDELFARQGYILDRMESLEFISEKEKGAAKKRVPNFSSKFSGLKAAPHFVMYVKEELKQNYGEDYLKKGGLKIYTTLDWELQEEAELILKKGVEKNEKYNAFNGALVALDPKTGQILAMVGSKDYFAKSYPEGCQSGKNCLFDPNVNVAIRNRQPGSAFKPFVYAKSFQKGYLPQTIIFDVKTEFNPACPGNAEQKKSEYGMDCYHPQNYDEKFRGPVMFKQALAQSLNVPSVKVLYLTGIEDSLNLAKEMGITTLNQPKGYYGLSLVLGGGEVKLLDLVSAFAVFAANGIKNEKTSILKIEDAKGALMEEWKANPQVVLQENIAFLINNILSDNELRAPIFGENSPLCLGKRPAAVKTGTSQDFRDAWTIGYTPSIACGVWAGNSDNSPIEKKAGVYIAAPIWNEFIKKAYETKANRKSQIANKNENNFVLPGEIEDFPKPEPQDTEKFYLNGEFVQKSTLKIDTISGKLAGPLTPPELIEEREFCEILSILNYVDKNDPLCQTPENPFLDSQYKNWEEGIKNWLSLVKNESSEGESSPETEISNGENIFIRNFELKLPPKEYDDLHTEENLPKIKIIFPPPKTVLEQNSPVNTEAFITSPLGLAQIEYFLNDTLLDLKKISTHDTEKKVEKSLFLPSQILLGNTQKTLEEKEYILKIRAVDIAKNQTEKEIPIIIK